MRILAIQHIDCEPLGALAEALADEGADVTCIHPFHGDELPPTLKGWHAAVILGGPMAVYDGGIPFLRQELTLVRAAIDSDRPLLGICLGSQIIAAAAGASVYAGPVRQAGWSPVKLTGAAAADAVFTGLESRLPVFQLHGDTFDLPAGAVRLARDDDYANQAFRIGNNVYGLQFHVEITPQLVSHWADAYEEYIAGAGVSRADLLEGSREKCESLAPVVSRLARHLTGAR